MYLIYLVLLYFPCPQMFRAPFTKVLLRDNFAANIMCSFSPVIAGVLYCGCYFGTGAFLYTADPNHDTGNEKYHTCASSDTMTGLVVLCFSIPLCIRLFQCLRQLYEYKVAPWTQPANNTTVDYSQQTSLDPSEDPTTEWGHTWLSPMMCEFDKMNQSNNSSDSSSGGGEGDGRGKEVDIINGAHVVNTASHGEIELVSYPDIVHPNSVIKTDSFEPSTSANPKTDSANLGDVGLRARPRGWSSVPRLMNDVSQIDVHTAEDNNAHSTYPCNSTHKGTQQSTHSHVHTSNLVNLKLQPGSRGAHKHDTGLSHVKTQAHSPVPDSTGRTNSNSNSNSSAVSKHHIEWGSTFFNPFHTQHTHVGDADGSVGGSHEHDSNDESHSSNLDSSHFSHTFHYAGGETSHTHRSAHAFRSIIRKICATPIKILSPYYYSLRSHTDPWYARFKTVWIWPHAQNAFQYVLQIMVVLIGAFPPQEPSGAAYITCFSLFLAFTVVYVSYWDIVVDCQLLQADSEKPFLRKKLYYEEYELFYYAFLFLNPVCRLLYLLSFTPFGRHPAFALFEIARRIGWAILRMEVAYVQELARRRAH